MIPYVTAKEREETRQLAIRYRRMRAIKTFMFGFTTPALAGITIYVFIKFVELTGSFGAMFLICVLCGIAALIVNKMFD